MRHYLMAAVLACIAIMMVPGSSQAQQTSDSYAFIEAVKKDDTNSVLSLLNAHGRNIVNSRANDGSTALHIVVADRRSRWIRSLLRRGARIDARDGEGRTPLFIAATIGDLDVVETLLALGADPDIGNNWGETPLIAAVHRRDPNLAKMLLEKGADPDQADSAAGLSARDYALRDERAKDVLALIDGKDDEPEPKLKFGPVLR